MKIKISKSQKKKIQKFLYEQDQIVLKEQAENISFLFVEDLTDNNLLPYYGSIGASYTIMITPTSLGNIIKIKHEWTKEILDITEYEKW